MPYKKTGVAIAHYLILFRRIAELYGNPFIIAYLPDPVIVDDKKYSRETLSRYLSWIKKFYRERGREPPIRIEYVRDRVRGRVTSVYVEVEKIDDELTWLKNDETPWPYRERGRRDKEIEKLRARIRRLEEKLAKCNEEVSRYRIAEERWREEIRDYTETIRAMSKELAELRRKMDKLSKRNDWLTSILRRLATLTPEQMLNCVDLKPDSIECDIVRLILDKAITYVDDVTPLDIVMSEIGDEYAEELDRISKKVIKILS